MRHDLVILMQIKHNTAFFCRNGPHGQHLHLIVDSMNQSKGLAIQQHASARSVVQAMSVFAGFSPL
jgi:hypothetical protein